MSEPTITPLPKPRNRLTLVLVAGCIAVLVLTVGGLNWWWRHHASGVTGSPDESRNHPARKTTGTAEVVLFNGTDLEGWEFDPAIWSVRDGVIYGHQQQGGYGSSLFWHDADIADFELYFRFRLVRGNSGIYYRASRLANFDVGGYEFEIYTNKTGNLADNGTDREKRRLHRVESSAPPLDSEWHEGIIIANGSRLVHWLDGKAHCVVEDTDPAAPRTGAIALAMTTGTIVEFKDVRLRRMRPTP